MYEIAIENLRCLLAQLGRSEFRIYGYAAQLRNYRVLAKANRAEARS